MFHLLPACEKVGGGHPAYTRHLCLVDGAGEGACGGAGRGGVNRRAIFSFHLLPSREEVGQRHPAHARHLCVVDEAHELLQKPLGKVGVLEAVDCQAAAGVGVASLKEKGRTRRAE